MIDREPDEIFSTTEEAQVWLEDELQKALISLLGCTPNTAFDAKYKYTLEPGFVEERVRKLMQTDGT
jgi:hypothetical protein